MQQQTPYVLRSLPPGATYEDIVRTPKSRYDDHQLAATYRAQLKEKTQLIG
jgi:hypothetical protein